MNSDTGLGRATGLAAALTLPVFILEMGAYLIPAVRDFVQSGRGRGRRRVRTHILHRVSIQLLLGSMAATILCLGVVFFWAILRGIG